ncbi:MAG: hypothetical protein LBL82_05305 [Oscillospiraceae bacterium]|jgi:electron transport complex protein RnfA|nr:hypothetical protein [Oscillospiraceae bacterium]
MTTAGGFFAYAVIAVFAANALTSGMTDIDSVLTALSKPKQLLIMSLAVAAFSFGGCAILFPVDTILPGEMQSMPVRGLVFSLIILGLYFIGTRIFSSVAPNGYKKYGALLAPAAINGAALGAPLFVSYYTSIASEMASDTAIIAEPSGVAVDFALSLGVGIGSGAGFALSAFLICEGLRKINNPDVSPYFRGAPIMMIYVGLLALAFWGVGGGVPLLPFAQV